MSLSSLVRLAEIRVLDMIHRPSRYTYFQCSDDRIGLVIKRYSLGMDCETLDALKLVLPCSLIKSLIALRKFLRIYFNLKDFSNLAIGNEFLYDLASLRAEFFVSNDYSPLYLELQIRSRSITVCTMFWTAFIPNSTSVQCCKLCHNFARIFYSPEFYECCLLCM